MLYQSNEYFVIFQVLVSIFQFPFSQLFSLVQANFVGVQLYRGPGLVLCNLEVTLKSMAIVNMKHQFYLMWLLQMCDLLVFFSYSINK